MKIARFLKRLRFDFVAFPLTFEKILQLNPKGFEGFLWSVQQSESLYPSIADDLQSLADCFDKIAYANDNWFLQRLVELLHECSSQRIVFKEARGVEQSLKAIRAAGIRNVEAIASQRLRNSTVEEGLIVLGPTRWFPRYVFDAPRTRTITCVHYDCVSDTYSSEPVFAGAQLIQDSKYAARGRGPSTNTAFPDENRPQINEQVNPDDLLPKIDWRGFSYRGTGPTNLSEMTSARFFLLSDYRILVLEADNSKTHVARPELENSVVFISVDEIEKGDFVLIRESDKGNYLTTIADRILGPDASSHRQVQASWKRQLREKVDLLGSDESIVQLIQFGCSRANYQNLRNWQSESNIKTRDKSDFAALMEFSGLSELVDEYWDRMGAIDRAHVAAGRYVRESLIRQLNKTDANQLALSGKLSVELPDVQTSGVAAVRIEDCSPTSIDVPRSIIGDFLNAEEFSWQ